MNTKLTVVEFREGRTKDQLTRIADWVINRGVWDIQVIYRLGDEPSANAWTEIEWMSASELWCHPFYMTAITGRSSPFSLRFPDDDTAVLFMVST